MYSQVEALTVAKSIQWLYRLCVPFFEQHTLYHSCLRLSWKIIYQSLFTVQMDCGFGIQFTFSNESPQVRKAKIRNSISPSTTGINHTSVTDKERRDSEREHRVRRESSVARYWILTLHCIGL